MWIIQRFSIHFPSLSYLQLENRVLPPIDAACRSIGRNASTDTPFTIQPATSSKCTGPTVATTTTTNEPPAFECRSAASTNDAATINGPIPTGCIDEQKGDNSSTRLIASASAASAASPSTTTTVNYNSNMTANRTIGQPKLPALESKTVVPSNCK